MTEGDRAAVYIHVFDIPAKILVDRACLGSEGFICLYQVEIVGRPASFFQRHAAGRDWSGTHNRRIDAGRRPGDDAGERAQTALLGIRCAHQHDSGGAVVDAGGVAGSDRSVLVEGRAQLGQDLDGRAVLGILVSIDDRLATAGRDLDRHDLVLEPAGLLRRFGLGLRGGGEGVLLIAGDLPALGDVLCGVAHVIAVERVPEPIAYHRVDELGIAHLHAVAQVDAVRRLAHALLTAGDDDLGITVADRLIAERHGAQSRTAELVDAIGGHLIGDAGGDRGLAGRVLALAGGEDLAHDHLANFFRLDIGAPKRLDDRDLAELVRRQTAEPTVESPNGGAGSARNHDIGHRGSPRRITRIGKVVGNVGVGLREVQRAASSPPAEPAAISRPAFTAYQARSSGTVAGASAAASGSAKLGGTIRSRPGPYC